MTDKNGLYCLWGKWIEIHLVDELNNPIEYRI